VTDAEDTPVTGKGTGALETTSDFTAVTPVGVTLAGAALLTVDTGAAVLGARCCNEELAPPAAAAPAGVVSGTVARALPPVDDDAGTL